MHEYSNIPVDDTVKICMPILGQSLPRRAKRLTSRTVIFRPSERYRCVFTTRGASGCVLGMSPRPDNKENTLVNVLKHQVQFVASDRCSPQLHTMVAGEFPGLQMITLDTTHLVMVYEYAMFRKKTTGSSLLRSIMARFNKSFAADSLKPSYCNGIFDGTNAAPCIPREQQFRDYIKDLNMPLDMATRVASRQKDAGVIGCREEFAEALAALCALYPHEVKKTSPGPNRAVSKILLSNP